MILRASDALASSGSVKVLAWQDYIQPNIAEAFEAETGIALELTTFGSNDEAESTIRANSSGMRQGEAAILFVRPERVAFDADLGNSFNAQITRRDMEGSFLNYEFTTENGAKLTMHTPNIGLLMSVGNIILFIAG
ncbi:hypothetical protein TG4357_02949 [Thalassovita gelatinovora]|uniref:Transport-associated OB type 2 domain-containing protein n=1 Tax=Thalassovita gelatinovora TaxID=53501 RepID=A0A0P1G5A3_THAGE|nr:TOBE domain-containing protein [Thalassovita gelatinovora]QIZ81945.1 TOBE domain-containing protein [Thalassovita gelatinovora]CUH67340.1 hypothetical protein TG4357_02949 [Thalassovita gelatinovora]SEP76007.1 TOBE domain-containing protein [Thalassovita gelatinovora]